MGLIAALASSAHSTFKDQWKEYFYCDSLSSDVLVARGKKRDTGKSNKGNNNIISNGSVVAVADGQCMLIVEQGKVVEVCAEPGEFVFDNSTESSIMAGELNLSSIKKVFATIGKRFTFGGELPKEQRVYYINTKEIIGNKYGTATPVPFDIEDRNINFFYTASIRCFGEYSFKIVNPLAFYKEIVSNISGDYTRDQLESQMRSELLTALQPAFGRLSAKGIRYAQLPAYTMEIADSLNDILSEKWGERRGIEICEFGINSVSASEEDEKTLKSLQVTGAYASDKMANAAIKQATAQAMVDAANNTGGAAMAFMGMNMASNMGAGAIGAINQASNTAAAEGSVQSAPQPAKADVWTCPSCGKENAGKFCQECGAKKPEAPGTWVCPSCGISNTGKFCTECGTKKPSAACSACGWTPEDPSNPPKFCPECGKAF